MQNAPAAFCFMLRHYMDEAPIRFKRKKHATFKNTKVEAPLKTTRRGNYFCGLANHL
jgi:hypothetical protein